MAGTDVSEIAPVERMLDRQIKVVEIVLTEVEMIQELCLPCHLRDDEEQRQQQHRMTSYPADSRAQVRPLQAVFSLVQSRYRMARPERHWPVGLARH